MQLQDVHQYRIDASIEGILWLLQGNSSSNLACHYCNGADSANSAHKRRGHCFARRARICAVVFFTKPYDAATASSDPGIRLYNIYWNKGICILRPQNNLRYIVRYMIEKDINAGIPLIDEKICGVSAEFRAQPAGCTCAGCKIYCSKIYAGNCTC